MATVLCFNCTFYGSQDKGHMFDLMFVRTVGNRCDTSFGSRPDCTKSFVCCHLCSMDSYCIILYMRISPFFDVVLI